MSRARLPLDRTSGRGFTLLELLIAMSLFAVLGLAIIGLLGRGMTLFSDGTANTRMQDRLQAILPVIRADLAAVQPAAPPEVLPPPPADDAPSTIVAGEPPKPPDVRFRLGRIKLSDLDDSWGTFPYVALVRTNARESEDPLLRAAGASPAAPGVPLRSYDPATVDAVTGSKSVVSLLAPGGQLEVVWIAVPEDPDPARRSPGPITVGAEWSRGMLTLYRLFRAPAGGERSLLDPKNFDSIAKIRAAGRPMHEGVLHFGVTVRNAFARSWSDGSGTGRVEDGQAYVGTVWDSTRGLDKDFPLFRGAASIADVRDDVFPAWAKLELTLGTEGEFGFGRGETFLSAGASPEDKRLTFENVQPLYDRALAGPLWLKVQGEWMTSTFDGLDAVSRQATVVRGLRGTKAVAHEALAPVFLGRTVTTEVPMVFKDRFVPRSR